MIPANRSIIPRKDLFNFVVSSGRRYWQTGQEYLIKTFDSDAGGYEIKPTDYVEIDLPPEYSDLGVDGKLVLPQFCFLNSAILNFSTCDLWLAAFWFLSCAEEFLIESVSGSVQSYSRKFSSKYLSLTGQAWANRILLILRRKTALSLGMREEVIFGKLPEGKITFTVDVDALEKTAAIRIKNFIFELYLIIKSLCSLKLSNLKHHTAQLFLSIHHRDFDSQYIELLNATAGLKHPVVFHFFPGILARKSFKRWLLDPAYNLEHKKAVWLLKLVQKKRGIVGIHPSFFSAENKQEMLSSVKEFQIKTLLRPKYIRQHWLRFSLLKTWEIQGDADLLCDSTFGFNDRPGFRGGFCLKMNPWNWNEGLSHKIKMVPLIFMDSQLHQYGSPSEETWSKLEAIFREVYLVGGDATVLWHAHTLHSDYGWKPSMLRAIDLIKQMESTYAQ